MDFPINGKAEGRILVPWEHKKYPELAISDTSGIVPLIQFAKCV